MAKADLSAIKPDKEKALMLAQREVAVFVHDAVLLEGINFTLPEIQTLMEGITLGGRKLSEQQIAINQHNAWKQLFSWIKNGEFELTKERVCELHAIAGKEEALKWGEFRSGGVTIAGTSYLPPDARELPALFNAMCEDLDNISDIYDKAIHAFLTMARCQFFYDVNKRMGRFVMNGILLSAGYPAINLPASKQLEFNENMLEFYESGDEQKMNSLLRSCIDERIHKIMSE